MEIRNKININNLRNFNDKNISRIAKTNGDFSFAVISDTRDGTLYLDNVLNIIDRENILFSVNGGDFIHTGNLYEYIHYLRKFDKLKKPMILVIGNHEVHRDGRNNFYKMVGKSYFSFAVGNSYFIMLDDVADDAKYEIDDKQFEWLKAELEKSKNFSHRFVFMHVPLQTPFQQERLELSNHNRAEMLNDLFDAYRIDMVFASHVHGYYSGKWGQTPFTVTAGGGSPLKPSGPDHAFYHYIKVEVTAADVKYNIIKLPPKEHENLDRLLYNIFMAFEGYFMITALFFSTCAILYFIIRHRKLRD